MKENANLTAATSTEKTDKDDVSLGNILLFWGGIIGALAAAYLLDFFMPHVPEYIFERIMMIPLAAFFIYFLIKLR